MPQTACDVLRNKKNATSLEQIRAPETVLLPLRDSARQGSLEVSGFWQVDNVFLPTSIAWQSD